MKVTINDIFSEDKAIHIRNGKLYGSILNIPLGSNFLNYVGSLDTDSLNDNHSIISFLGTIGGKRLLFKEFRRLYFKPIKKFFRNRKIGNLIMFKICLRETLLDFDFLENLGKDIDNGFTLEKALLIKGIL
jgi:hypothetical protein